MPTKSMFTGNQRVASLQVIGSVAIIPSALKAYTTITATKF